MPKKKQIDTLGGWDWDTLVAAWRYYEHGCSIVSAGFMYDIIKRFFSDTKTYTDKVRYKIANQFANIDHGIRGENEWPDCDNGCSVRWRKFYRFCDAWANNRWYKVILDGENPPGKHIHEEVVAFKFGDRYYPRDRYIAEPWAEVYCGPEFIREIKEVNE